MIWSRNKTKNCKISVNLHFDRPLPFSPFHRGLEQSKADARIREVSRPSSKDSEDPRRIRTTDHGIRESQRRRSHSATHAIYCPIGEIEKRSHSRQWSFFSLSPFILRLFRSVRRTNNNLAITKKRNDRSKKMPMRRSWSWCKHTNKPWSNVKKRMSIWETRVPPINEKSVKTGKEEDY